MGDLWPSHGSPAVGYVVGVVQSPPSQKDSLPHLRDGGPIILFMAAFAPTPSLAKMVKAER